MTFLVFCRLLELTNSGHEINQSSSVYMESKQALMIWICRIYRDILLKDAYFQRTADMNRYLELIRPFANSRYFLRCPTELVHHSTYRGSSHWRKDVAGHITRPILVLSQWCDGWIFSCSYEDYQPSRRLEEEGELVICGYFLWSRMIQLMWRRTNRFYCSSHDEVLWIKWQQIVGQTGTTIFQEVIRECLIPEHF